MIPRVYGRQALCSYGLARNYYPLPNNKLETVADFLGLDFEKGESYESVEEKIRAIESECANQEALVDDIKRYCAADAETHFEALKRMLPSISKLARAYSTDASSVCFVSKDRNASNYWNRNYFGALHAFRSKWAGDPNFDIVEEKQRMVRLKVNLKRETAFVDEPVIVAMPRVFEPVLARHDENIKYLNDEVEDADDFRDAMVLQQGLESLCGDAVASVFNESPSVYARFGRVPGQFDSFFKNSAAKLASVLKRRGLEVINYDDRFLFMRADDTDAAVQMIKGSYNFVLYGVSPRAISVGSKCIIAEANDVLISPGLAIYGRSNKINFETDVILGASRLALAGDLDAALDYLVEECNRFNERGVDKSDLIFRTRIGQELDEYSAQATKTGRYRALTRLEPLPEKGDRVEYGYAVVDGEPAVLRREQFMGEKVDLARYRKKLFGVHKDGGETKKEYSKGSISRIALVLFGERRAESQPLFDGYLRYF